MPNDWCNYEEKKWANIVTINTVDGVEKKAYFVWIPRYEYKLRNTWQEVEVRFIPSSQTTASEDAGYKLPEAFWWDNNNNGELDNGESLPGYWVTKYEISQ